MVTFGLIFNRFHAFEAIYTGTALSGKARDALEADRRRGSMPPGYTRSALRVSSLCR